MKNYLVERSKLVRVAEFLNISARSEAEARLLAHEYTDKRPKTRVLSEHLAIVGVEPEDDETPTALYTEERA